VKRYRLSPEAQGDIEDIRKYLVKEGGAALARYVLGEIRQALRFLAETPGAGHARDDLTDEPVKFWSVFSYLIIYDPATQPLGIARILHASRDLETMFRHQPPRADR
jgi:antitoxin ParD1/3/4/toxin ParE1/3/4